MWRLQRTYTNTPIFPLLVKLVCCLKGKACLWLEGHCTENEISCIGFDTPTDIQRVIEGAMGKAEKKEGSVGQPTRFNSGGDVSITRSK